MASGHSGIFHLRRRSRKLGNWILGSIRTRCTRLWFRALRRRSQRHRLTWDRMMEIADAWLPRAAFSILGLNSALPLSSKVGAVCSSAARTV
jgi:hypothetical protein